MQPNRQHTLNRLSNPLAAMPSTAGAPRGPALCMLLAGCSSKNDAISQAEKTEKDRPSIAETKDTAGQGFIFGLPLVMNYAAMNAYSINTKSPASTSPLALRTKRNGVVNYSSAVKMPISTTGGTVGLAVIGGKHETSPSLQFAQFNPEDVTHKLDPGVKCTGSASMPGTLRSRLHEFAHCPCQRIEAFRL